MKIIEYTHAHISILEKLLTFSQFCSICSPQCFLRSLECFQTECFSRLYLLMLPLLSFSLLKWCTSPSHCMYSFGAELAFYISLLRDPKYYLSILNPVLWRRSLSYIVLFASSFLNPKPAPGLWACDCCPPLSSSVRASECGYWLLQLHPAHWERPDDSSFWSEKTPPGDT